LRDALKGADADSEVIYKNAAATVWC